MILIYLGLPKIDFTNEFKSIIFYYYYYYYYSCFCHHHLL